jgi:hypothetical protein
VKKLQGIIMAYVYSEGSVTDAVSGESEIIVILTNLPFCVCAYTTQTQILVFF